MCPKSASIIRATAPAKVILFGEHSVVYGAPAIAASIDRRTTVQLAPNDSKNLRFKFDSINVDESFSLPVETVAVPAELGLQQRQAIECGLIIFKSLRNAVSEGVTVTVTSDFPLGAGLGSSASFSVSMSAAFVILESLQCGIDCEKNPDGTIIITNLVMSRIRELADKCERVFHGNPSGIDTATCSLGGIVRFQRDSGVEKIADSLPMKIAVVDSKVERQTSAVVKRVKDLRSSIPAPSLEVFSAMTAVAEAAAEEIRNCSSCKNLLHLVRMNHGLLYALGVSHPVLERIGLAVADLGVGFKLTGAGAGGNALVFIPPDVSPDVVRTELNRNGFDPNVVTVGVKGVEVTLTDS